jgi:haloacetate dehalogenase
MFDGFETKQITTSGTTINLVQGGQGPPLLLLHGSPQSHVMWHKVAPRLAQEFTVVAPDLRGYGDSGKPDGGPEHEAYSKRVMARDQVEVMEQLGYDSFLLAGHDRGARVSHRLTKDHPERVRKLAVLDIIPSHRVWATMDAGMARYVFTWFFRSQPFDFPERLIGASADYYIRRSFEIGEDAAKAFPAEAVAEYVRAFRDPATIHAQCEDYRAGAGIDRVHDEADWANKVSCPVLALWSATGYVGRTRDVLQVWWDYATDVRGQALPCGHWIAEELPDQSYAALRAFFLEPETMDDVGAPAAPDGL